jgi:hypothetical protein
LGTFAGFLLFGGVLVPEPLCLLGKLALACTGREHHLLQARKKLLTGYAYYDSLGYDAWVFCHDREGLMDDSFIPLSVPTTCHRLRFATTVVTLKNDGPTRECL